MKIAFIATIGVAFGQSCDELDCAGNNQECACRWGNDDTDDRNVVKYYDDCKCSTGPVFNDVTCAGNPNQCDGTATNFCENSFSIDEITNVETIRGNCMCPPGMEADLDFQLVDGKFKAITTCIDANECDRETDECDENATCTNKVVAQAGDEKYKCDCNEGYEGNGFTCEVPTTTTTTTTPEPPTTTTITTTTTPEPPNCPTDCWQVNADNECEPVPEATSISCSSDGMVISVDHCVFADTETFKAHLTDDSCATNGNIMVNGTFTLESALDGCGTAISHNDTLGEVTFSQTVYAMAYSGPIYLGNPLEMQFSCVFDSHTNATTNADFQKLTTQTGSEGAGVFEFDLSLFEDETFDSALPEDDVIVVGERVYFAVSGAALPDTVSYVLNTCKVINHDETMEYPMLSDGCPDTLVQVQYDNGVVFNSTHPAQISYSAFRFDTDDVTSDQQETISCSITVCDNDDEDSVCNTLEDTLDSC